MARPREASKGAGGLVLINKTDFSAASSVSIDNCFSSTYQNYKLIYNFDSAASSLAIKFNGRTSGTNNTSNVYYYATARNRSGSASLAVYDRGTPQTYILLGESNTGVGTGDFTIYNPFATKATEIGGLAQNNIDFYWTGGHYDNTTSFDGFSLTFTVNTTGTLRVYGIRN